MLLSANPVSCTTSRDSLSIETAAQSSNCLAKTPTRSTPSTLVAIRLGHYLETYIKFILKFWYGIPVESLTSLKRIAKTPFKFQKFGIQVTYFSQKVHCFVWATLQWKRRRSRLFPLFLWDHLTQVPAKHIDSTCLQVQMISRVKTMKPVTNLSFNLTQNSSNSQMISPFSFNLTNT